MTKRLRSLQNAGLVRRSPSRLDGRSTLVQLTPKGRKLIDTVVFAHVANEARLVGLIDEDARMDLVALLRHFLLALGDDAGTRISGAPAQWGDTQVEEARGRE